MTNDFAKNICFAKATFDALLSLACHSDQAVYLDPGRIYSNSNACVRENAVEMLPKKCRKKGQHDKASLS